jgi:hypothetical protein
MTSAHREVVVHGYPGTLKAASEPRITLHFGLRRHPSRVLNLSANEGLTADGRLAHSPGLRSPLSLFIHA